ncbi:MAG: hypothetical protein PHT50_02110 [Candidatus Omnitrophica bacterium]|nr:hypothetical protein [Candidatus Omnitrophota bacterium]
MKKLALFLVLIFTLTKPSYAVNIIDQLINKEVVLVANRMTVLVNRITGEVKYIKLNNGRWMPLKGGLKNKCQLMYDNQSSSRPALAPALR